VSVSTVAQSGCNRRILKAFYTQYVAVLLIVLVFTLGAFQRASHTGNRDALRKNNAPQAHGLGSITLSQVFTDEGSVVPNQAELKALATVLKEHDLKIVIAIPTNEISSRPGDAGVSWAMREVASLERYFKAEGISSAAIRYLVYGRSESPGTIKIYLEEAFDDTVILQ
jgi:hypothetical protein